MCRVPPLDFWQQGQAALGGRMAVGLLPLPLLVWLEKGGEGWQLRREARKNAVSLRDRLFRGKKGEYYK